MFCFRLESLRHVVALFAAKAFHKCTTIKYKRSKCAIREREFLMDLSVSCNKCSCIAKAMSANTMDAVEKFRRHNQSITVGRTLENMFLSVLTVANVSVVSPVRA